jgi:dinuclear metal center YbgI/SA1388 family protein
MARAATLADVVRIMEELYPPALAADWDAVGLVCGDPSQEVESVLLAVDAARAVVDEAVGLGIDVLITHHPLFLRPVHGVAVTHPKGRIVHDLIRARAALFVAHTNADTPPGGVADALARAIGLTDLRPIVPVPDAANDKIVVFVPGDYETALIDALASAGAGTIGAYDRAAFSGYGTGTFRPSDRARPFIGEPGRIEVVDERRLEMIAPRARRSAVLSALRAAHPYEEPAIDVIEVAPMEGATGMGRVGVLAQPCPLGEFAARVVEALPPTVAPARVAGDADRAIRVVAVQGGAGDDLFDEVRDCGADVYVTSDLRHHPALEAREFDDAPALVDVPHWAAEWTWLPVLRSLLAERLEAAGLSVRTSVSDRRTDPWNDVRVRQPPDPRSTR